MRAAAFLAGAIIGIGIFLAVASALAFSPAMAGLGSLGVAAIAAVALVASESRASSVRITSPAPFDA